MTGHMANPTGWKASPIPFARLSSTALQPLTCLPKTWENFPNEQIKFIRNKADFNFKLKEYFLNNLSNTPSCDRLFCPSCNNVETYN